MSCHRAKPEPEQKRAAAVAAPVVGLAGAELVRESPHAVAGEWPTSAGDYSGTRFSPLETITPQNVAQLQLAWRFDTDISRGHEAAPIVVGDTLYVTTPFPNRVHAFDLKRPGAPPKWTYEARPEPRARGVACCDVVNRGAAVAGGKVFFNTLDNHTIALDAADGHELWNAKLGETNRGESMTMAPLVVKDLVLVGNSGGEFGVRGWLTALSAADGSVRWRAYSTGPDADVLIGPWFKPFYPQDRGADLGMKTWPPDKWKTGGGTVWGFISYDPGLDLIFYGTGNPGPWNPEQRFGDNKWTAGVFARHPDDGQAAWFYQYSPHDLYDYDGVNENVLFDVMQGGRKRPLLIHPDRNGYMYLLDRSSGEVLSAEQFVHVTTSHRVDLKSGKLITEPSKEPHVGQLVQDACPAAPGAKDWQPSAFSPRTGLLYVPHNNLCQDEEAQEANYIAGTPYVGATTKFIPGPGKNAGEFCAWDPLRAKKVWSITEKFPVWSGALVTSSGVVFYGTMDGWFKAVEASSGKLLWKMRAESGFIGQPVSFLGPDGKQYVAVMSGVGGWAGLVVVNKLDVGDPTAGSGFVVAMKDLPQATKAGGSLLVFALGEAHHAG
ncbi:MAG TPA: PQQ-dependent dehydrogenase, methanol/ethanol family [Polyangiaceae bacterium]|nr:PQQ-dependent dehydrogenase, methanol/ethanol family [Polyangiaceae bacterium]